MKTTALLTGALTLALSAAAFASENGGDNIGAGSDGFFVAPLDVNHLPDHLFVFDVYYNHYSTTQFDGTPLPAFEKATATVIAPRIDYLSPVRLLGARVGGYVSLPHLKMTVSDGLLGQDEESGQGDITFAPLLLWDHGKDLTIGAALEITKPTGTYDPLRMANTSTNFTTYKPVIPITWQPAERAEVSAKFSYSFNQTNKDTDYKSGRYAHVDYSLSYEAIDNLHVGVNGYFLKQVSDDRMGGVDVGNRGKAAAIGPALHLTFLKYASAELRWEKEFSVENRPKGTNVWAKLTIPMAW